MVAGFAGSAPGRTKAPRNAWYVVVFSDEIAEKPLARTILGDRVVMYRTSSGKVTRRRSNPSSGPILTWESGLRM